MLTTNAESHELSRRLEREAAERQARAEREEADRCEQALRGFRPPSPPPPPPAQQPARGREVLVTDAASGPHWLPREWYETGRSVVALFASTPAPAGQLLAAAEQARLATLASLQDAHDAFAAHPALTKLRRLEGQLREARDG